MSLRSRADLIVALRRAGCVFAEEEADLLLAEPTTEAELTSMVDRRVAGEPLEIVLGWVEFCGLRILLDAGVFVPRQRSALLVRTAAEFVADGGAVVDLCCGSGAIGAALLAERPSIDLYCAEIDPVAAACAERNVSADRVFLGDLFDPLPQRLRGAVQLIAANAPYVPSEGIRLMPPEARLYEPGVALDGGRDGLDLHRRIAAVAGDWLAPGGALVIEASEVQAPASVEIFAARGFAASSRSDDEIDATVVIAVSSAGR